MTQIRSMAQPVPRRPGELGVHSLDHFNLLVPDVAEAEKFYGLFGLEHQGGGRQARALHPRPSAPLGHGRRRPAQEVQLRLVRRVRGRHAALPRAAGEAAASTGSTRPRASRSNGLWFRDPDGTLIEIRVAEKSSPNAKATFEMKGGEVVRQNAPNRSKAHTVQPRRLAHVLLFVTRHLARRSSSTATCWDLRLSDRSGDLRRLHARHPRQRPSHDRVREVGRARACII